MLPGFRASDRGQPIDLNPFEAFKFIDSHRHSGSIDGDNFAETFIIVEIKYAQLFLLKPNQFVQCRQLPIFAPGNNNTVWAVTVVNHRPLIVVLEREVVTPGVVLEKILGFGR